jgi:DNA-binding MarR family transcriptional regulator
VPGIAAGDCRLPARGHADDRLGVTKQASGQLITDLEKRGYVRREDHPRGGRRRLIVLTDKALAHLEAAGAILHQLESEIAARAGGDALLALRTELAQLIRAMTGDGDIPPLRPLW